MNPHARRRTARRRARERPRLGRDREPAAAGARGKVAHSQASPASAETSDAHNTPSTALGNSPASSPNASEAMNRLISVNEVISTRLESPIGSPRCSSS